MAIEPTPVLQPVLKTAAFVYNHDICGIATRLNRFITEVIRSNSSNVATTTDADKQRLRSYLDALDAYLDWVMAQPQLDLPQTSHDAPWPIWPIDPVPLINNEDMEDFLRMLLVAHSELVTCESARQAARLSAFDESRMRALVAKARAFLTAFVDKASPLDLPASSPMDPITPAAK